MVKASPATIWDSTRAMYAGLPELSLTGAYDRALAWLGGTWGWVFGEDPAPEAAAAGAGAEAEPPAPAALNPLDWLGGR